MKTYSMIHCVALFCALLLIFGSLPGCSCGDDDDDHVDDVAGEDDDDAVDDDDNDDSIGDDDDNDTAPVSDEPPVNPFLADSPWPMNQRNPYCQGSSPYPGPEPEDELTVSYLKGSPVSVFMLYSPEDANGRRAVWGSTIMHAYTIDAGQSPLTYFDMYEKELDVGNPIAGAYTVLDKDNTLFAPQNDRIHAFTTQDPADVTTPIVERGSFSIPDPLPGEAMIGLNMTWDGTLIFATDSGRVGALTRDFSDVQMLQLSGEEEELSNSFAVDEDGGIYIVTSKRMYRVQWTGDELTLDPAAGAWSAEYDTGPAIRPPGRLGVGSGTTPSLMGVGDQDKFVVIGDGRTIMHLVLFWRDEIPEDWEPIAPGVDRRIAAEAPITFGDASAEITSTEQSVLVRGYGAVTVSNYYGPYALPSVLAAGFSNWPLFAPYGVEKFKWDPNSRTLTSTWTNPDISCPNGIPSMSEATGLMYCIGQRDQVWTLEGIDWETGESAFHHLMAQEVKYNSYYAHTEIGPDKNIITGTLTGTVDLRPK